MSGSQEGNNVHSTNIRELIAYLKRNKDSVNDHNKEVTDINSDVKVLQKQYITVEYNKRRKLSETQNLQPSIKNCFNVKSEKYVLSGTVRDILNKLKNENNSSPCCSHSTAINSHSTALEDNCRIKVGITKSLNTDQILWKSNRWSNKNKEISDTFGKIENNRINKLELKLPSFTNRQLCLTDFCNVKKEDGTRNTGKSCKSFSNIQLRHGNGHNINSDIRSEVLRMIEGFKKEHYEVSHREETKLRNNKRKIVPSYNSKNEQDESKTTFDDFCTNVMKTINDKPNTGDSASKGNIRKSILANKENCCLPKSCSTGQIIERRYGKNRNSELHSLPITDNEIESRQEKLEQNKITFDDFMQNILRDINNSRHMVDHRLSQEKGPERCITLQEENSIEDDTKEATTIQDLLNCLRRGKNRNQERKGSAKSDSCQENLKLENSQRNNDSCRAKNVDQLQNAPCIEDSKFIEKCGISEKLKNDNKESESEDFLLYFPNLVASGSTKQPGKIHKEPDFQTEHLKEDPNLIKAYNSTNETEYINSINTEDASMHTQNEFYLDDYQARSVDEKEQFLDQSSNMPSCTFLPNNLEYSVLLENQFSERNSNEDFENGMVASNNLLGDEKVTNKSEKILGSQINPDKGKENDILQQFFENLIKDYTSKRIRVPKIEPLQKKKHPVKRYKKGIMKIYRLKRLKTPKTSTNTVEQVEENLNLNDLLKKLTQDIVDSEHTLSRSKSMSSVSTPSSYITDVTKSDVLSTGSNDLTSPQQRLRKGINELSQDRSLLCNEKELEDGEHNKDELKMKIQEIFLKVAEDFVEKKHSSLKLRKQSFDNCIFENGRLQLKPFDDSLMTSINSANVRSQTKFKLILYILKKIQTLLATDTKLTKRELFYQLKTLVSDQRVIDRIINAISCLLNVGMWALNIIAQKGLVFGNLKMLLSSGETLNCNIPGTLIPQDINDIVEIQSVAYFILVVEKESIFYKLIEEGLPDKLTRPFIMITGKGFPDLNTQLFLKKLWIIMSIPVFILVDADPHGINIMLNYRFGSVNNAHVSHHLAVPNAKWLGVYPSEVVNLNLMKEQLSERELKLVNHLLRTPYVECHPRIVDELKVLLQKKYKAEIEGLIKSDTYLSEVYLPNKFFTHNFI